MMHYWQCELCGYRWDLDAHDMPTNCPNCGSCEIDYTDDDDERLLTEPAERDEQ